MARSSSSSISARSYPPITPSPTIALSRLSAAASARAAACTAACATRFARTARYLPFSSTGLGILPLPFCASRPTENGSPSAL
eukprot:8581569-Pyramimonas_sp.AAC.1